MFDRIVKKIIEVSTFRAGDPEENQLITEDNLWGNPRQDALRRDFTINALFYDPIKQEILDYVGGFEDIKKHLLVTIGDPILRFRQDPVRMIRMEKFRARFGFHTTQEDLDALRLMKEEIKLASKARVLEELLRMIESGHLSSFFMLLHTSGLLKILLPHLDDYCAEEKETCSRIFTCIDALCKDTKPKRVVLLSMILWPMLEKKIISLGKPLHLGEIFTIIQETIREVLCEPFIHFPKKMKIMITFILHAQYRFAPLDRRKIKLGKLPFHPDFPLALEFLKLRKGIGDDTTKAYERIEALLEQPKKKR